MEGNVVSYVDRILMPGKLYLGIYDPEGLLLTVPATGTALLVIFAGKLLRNYFLKQQKKVILLLIAGIAFLVLAQIWNIIFPINKNIWTSSFVLQTGGVSFIFLAVFYYVIDVFGYKSWAFFFKVIGVNSILIYIS
jgi:predicted acyltransferase